MAVIVAGAPYCTGNLQQIPCLVDLCQRESHSRPGRPESIRTSRFWGARWAGACSLVFFGTLI